MQYYVLTDQDNCTRSAGKETEDIWRPKARDLQNRRRHFSVRRLLHRRKIATKNFG